jgi:F-type H+-transporting ATPase subunit delta
MEIVPSIEEAQKMHAQISQLEKARAASSELGAALANPAVPLNSKIAIVQQLATRLDIPPVGQRVLEVLVRNNRINQLGSILEAWRESINRASGVAMANVRSAHQLSSAEEEELRRALEAKTGKRIDLHVETDPSLLGGFVAKIGSEVFDASVAGRLERLEQLG